MIEIRQGTPGSGKSAAAVAQAIQHLKKGGVVAANFSLVDGWAETIASKSIMGRFSSEWAYRKAQSLYKRFYRVGSVESIRAINPVAESVDLYRDKGGYNEGNGLLIIDEAQLVFNSRKWEKNFEWIEFFTQHRKLGWNVVLIAHTIEMIDGQIRPLAEYASAFRNLQKVKLPVVGIPLSPFPLFLVIRRYAGLGAGANVVAGRDLFPLPLWAARLYDSLEVFSAGSWGSDPKPRRCGRPPAPPSGVGGLVNIPSPPRVSRLCGPHWDDRLQTMWGCEVIDLHDEVAQL